MTINTPNQKGKKVGAFGRVANISIKEPSEAESVRSNIRVVVRVRPENKQELQGGYSTVVRVLDERLLIFDPKEEEAPDFYHGRQRRGRDFLKRKNRDIRFAFDYVFDTEATNEDLYNYTTKGILDSLLDGYNCSVFAYGATGAGKTHTMKGKLDCPGVMFHTMMDLYKRMERIKEDKTCDVAVSYLEVYNEQIRDLLNPSDFLPVRDDPNKGTIVAGLSLHKPRSAEELLHMLEFGNKNRTQHPTDANAESSRSHAVFQVFVRQKERTANVSADVSVAKMSLIDLAGSERATVTKNSGVRFREGANINRSLLALGNCINALADGKSKGYVPYRNSKLTRLLKDSLGGNCRTVMIAAVSPSGMTYEDTYNTLKYADRAKNIKANLTRNVVSVDYHISHYAKLVEDLRGEVEQYKEKVRHYEEGTAIALKTPLESPHQCEVERLQGVLFSVFQDRMNIRKEIMELEGSERDLHFKIHQKERCLSRIGLVFADPTVAEKVTSKIQRSIYGSKKRQVSMVQRKLESQSRMDYNVKELQRVENEMKLVSPNGVTPEILQLTLRTRHLEVELRDTKRQVKYLKKLCRAQERETQATEKLIQSLLEGHKKQYLLLQAAHMATPDIDADYDAVRQMLHGEREIAWADQEMNQQVNGSGDGERKSSDSEFDINKLVEFPVLACVNTTPRTPVQKQNGKTPSVALEVAMTPCTPGTHRKGRFTPRRPSMPVFQMTPSTPRLSGSHQLLNTSVANSSTSKTYLTPSKSGSFSSHEGNTNESSSIQCNLSFMNTIDEGCEEIITGSATVTLNPCTSYLLNRQTTGSNSHNSNCNGQMDTSYNNTTYNSCSRKGNSRLNGTFTKTEGLESLLDSPVGCVMSKSSKNSLGSATFQSTCNNHTVQNQTFTSNHGLNENNHLAPVQNVNSHSSSVSSNESDDCYQRSIHNTNSMQQQLHHSNSQQHSNKVCNSNTVTKSKPQVLTSASTGQNGNANILNVTVTKSKPAVVPDKENITPPQDRRYSVVRSMNFDDMPSPAGKMTFAEVLKSPAIRTLQQAGIAPFSPRSPLCSKENLPSDYPVKNRGKMKIPRLSFRENDDPSNQEYKEDKTVSDLKRMGLPSVRYSKYGATRGNGNQPGYMRMTSAANQRNTYKSYSDENKPIGSAKRVKKEESKKLTKSIGVRRTQSMNYGKGPKWNNRF